MVTLSPANELLDDAAAPKQEPRLRITCDTGAEPAAEQSSVFSSIKQTATALVTAASEQAMQRARRTQKPTGLRDVMADRLDLEVQRANADQARRMAECTRAAFDSLVRHSLQPCFALDDNGLIVRWNAAMEAWTGLTELTALGTPIGDLFSDDGAEIVADATAALREAAEMPVTDAEPVFTVDADLTLRNGASASRVSLLPLYRIPHVVEAVYVLLIPATTLPQIP